MRLRVEHIALAAGLLVSVPVATAQDTPPLLSWEFEDVYTVGADPNAAGFGLLGGLAFGPQGELVVLDTQFSEVKVLDSTGAIVRSIGGRGQGPGEFMPPMLLLAVASDGLVYVLDAVQERLSVFSILGEFRESWRLPTLATGGRMPAAMAAVPGGILVRMDPPPRAFPGTIPLTQPILLVQTPDGGERIVWEFPPETSPFTPATMTEPSRMPPLFAPQPVWAMVAADRVVVGRTDRYELVLRDLESTEIAVMRRDVERRPVSSKFRDDLQRQVAEEARATGLPEPQKDAVTIGEYYPVIAGVLAGPENSILVLRGHGALDGHSADDKALTGESAGSMLADVFTPDGALRGTVSFPPGFVPMANKGDLIAGEQQHPVETVVRVLRLRF